MHRFSHQRLISFLGLLLVVLTFAPARADPTNISTLPLLNISGSGAVKPNLMLLYDNSGSMNFTYTPDYVANADTCRAGTTIADGTRGCTIGDPPFASSDFNRQYYNPRTRYRPPVRANGTSFNDMTSANTRQWTQVPNDGFGINNADLLGEDRYSTTNLVSGFPDLAWCDRNHENCQLNTTGYTYPTNARYRAAYVNGAPYYYSINVAEYCTDNTMTNCTSTAVNGDAPDGYPALARVRFCDSNKLTRCQAKFVGNYKYPRFSGENQNAPWWGTITIGTSSGDNALRINSVTAVGLSGTQVITRSHVDAANGTDTADKRAIVASALAAQIVAQTGLDNPFTACVTTPRHTSVPACSSYGITLGGANVLAVIPIACPAGAADKSISNCSPVTDNSRAGDNLMVSSGTGATALLTISGTTNSGNSQILKGLYLGQTSLITSLTLGKGIGASSVVSALRNAIGTRGTVTAYVGGTRPSSPLCEAQSNTTLCLIDTASNAAGRDISLSDLTNNGSGNNTRLRLSVKEAVSDVVPTATTGLGASIFVRTNIVSSRRAYPRDPARTDCQGETCSYDEEMTNFANWYAYYKSRNQMMKTAVGQAFEPVTDKYNVGLVSLSEAARQGTINKPLPFAGQDRSDWYTNLYGMTTSGATPVRLALNAIGKMYANREPYVRPKGQEAVRFPCQQNFTFITTDGYWNGEAPTGVGNTDVREDPARFCLRSKGCVDPRAQSVPSLADIALYWYNGGSNENVDRQNSLRPTIEDWTKPGVVPAADGENTRLHMKTYALGLGVDGIMTYEPNYDSAPRQGGDFYKVITGATSGCPWSSDGRWTWPDAQTHLDGGSLALQSRVDDLWHAAINGHGKYFSASDPLQVIEGLRSALSNIEVQVGAAAAAATSTPNISAIDNDIFAATFTTVRWNGRLSKRKIDLSTGAVSEDEVWNTSSLLGARVDARADSRRILMMDPGTRALEDFTFANFTGTVERSWFENKCNALPQCANLSDANRTIVNRGATIVGWLRGQQQYADDTLLRAYSFTDAADSGADGALPIVLGDIASSKPAYVRDPRKNYDRDGYADYRAANTGREPTVYIGANDGMLHAFHATTGEELWAYVPRITMKKLYLQASTNYGGSHQYTVDGSPEVADVQIGGSWKTVLVGGLNRGGRGYYALDVTDPDAPKALWELCADPAVCSGDNLEPELGYTFGNPQFGTIQEGDRETWVVFLTSGYNNIPGSDGVNGGTGAGWLLVVDLATGKVKYRISTRVGDAATPSGLAKITAITPDPRNDPKVTYVYGGDNTGKMWRFDFTVAGAPSVKLMADAGAGQPITTRPEVTTCRVGAAEGSLEPAARRMVVFGSGRLLDLEDVADPALQSLYVLKDSGDTIGSGGWRKEPTMVQKTLARQSANDADSPFVLSGNTLDWARHNGWFVDFSVNTGERVNIDPKVVAGTLSVVTNLPTSSTECSVGGTSNIYQFNVCAALNGLVGEPLSGNAAVGTSEVRTPDGELKVIVTDAKGKMIPKDLAPSISSGARRAGWRRVRD